jgi:hypothetical protein
MAPDDICHALHAHPFAEACYQHKSRKEIVQALAADDADPTDCVIWSLTPEAWRANLRLALIAKLTDESPISGLRA